MLKHTYPFFSNSKTSSWPPASILTSARNGCCVQKRQCLLLRNHHHRKHIHTQHCTQGCTELLWVHTMVRTMSWDTPTHPRDLHVKQRSQLTKASFIVTAENSISRSLFQHKSNHASFRDFHKILLLPDDVSKMQAAGSLRRLQALTVLGTVFHSCSHISPRLQRDWKP